MKAIQKMKDKNRSLVAAQIFKFANVGVLSTLLNYSCFYILFSVYSLNYMLSSATGYLLGVFVGFMFNKGWAFQYKKVSAKEPLQYIILYSFSLFLGLSFLRLLVDEFNIQPEIANIATITLTAITNFLGLRFWVFRKKESRVNN